MGRLIWVGEISGKRYELYESASGTILLRNVTDGKDYITLDGTTLKDASNVSLASHASRHAYGGSDALPTDGIRGTQFKVVFGTGSSVSVPAGGSVALAEGIHYVFCAANTRVEVYDDVAASWKTVISAGGNGLVFSDGTNARLFNSGAASESSNVRPIV
jgi:hypothetical protein